MVDERLLTVEEVADRLRVHPESVRRWLRDGKMRGKMISRRAGWRIPESAYTEWLASEEPEGKLAA